MDDGKKTIERLEKELESHRKRIRELTERAEQCDRAMESCRNSERACKEAESELQKERSRLELRVRERTMELTSANRSLLEEITGRKRMEKAFAESEKKYRDVVQNANSVILRMDPRGKITFINNFALQFFDYTEDEIMGKNVVGTIVPPTATSGRDLAAMILDIGKHPERYITNENENMRRNGERVWVAWTNRAIMDKEGNIAEILCIGNDITELKKAEDKLLEARNELEQRVKERTLELTNTNKTLQDEIWGRIKVEKELRDAKSQAELYVDLIGHDINNMNQVVMGYLELAMDNLGLDKDSLVLIKKPLEILTRSSKLISNVRKLQLARKGELPEQKIDIGPLLDELIKQYSYSPDRNIRMHYTPVRDCLVTANELLRDVFENIIGNAVKHSSGPLDIYVDVTVNEENGIQYYKIDIADNGPGIPDDLKAKLFAQKGVLRSDGHGLGLYLVSTLVYSFHGRVRVEDRVPGDYTKGSRFVVMLPVATLP